MECNSSFLGVSNQINSARVLRSARACTYGIRSGICHRQDALSSVWEAEIFISELLAINRLAASAVASGEISSLAHAAATKDKSRRVSSKETNC